MSGSLRALPQSRRFGRLADGSPVDIHTLSAPGLAAEITNYGARIVTLCAPDRDGRMDDITLGYDSFAGYLEGRPYFGAVVGRYANRIANGRFVLNGRAHQLACNEDGNCLHGGCLGFDRRLWRTVAADPTSLVLGYRSPDGEEGFPGTLDATVRYTLRAEELRIDYLATCDTDTVVNLSNHAFFNLAGTGTGAGSILGTRLTICADRYTPVDGAMIPTGELRSVSGTPFDFRTARTIGERIDCADDQLRIGSGYDHNFVLDRRDRGDGECAPAARAVDTGSGRTLEISTTEPGLQLYTGNRLGGSTGAAAPRHGYRSGFCLETQHFPDSPNQPEFPSTVLAAGATYRSTTVWRFSTV